jgi:vancomycin resistance protein YoaR
MIWLSAEKGYADSPTIKDLVGIKDGEGETVLFTFFQQNFYVKLSDYLSPVSLLLDFDALSSLAQTIQNQVAVKPQSAYIDENGNVVPHLSGIALDQNEFLSLMQESLYNETDMVEILPVRFVPPRVTTQTLKQSMEKMIAGFTTYYNSGNLNRSHNIKLASKAIHHYVVLPGETFSFNKVVGRRTTSKGYKRAPVIVRGEMSEDIGGGICQVSSTLFNAVDRAGLKIISRYSHTKQVGYVPPGRDATVSWYGPDFVFRNEYDYPIMIKCFAQSGSNTVLIYSSQMLQTELRQTPEAPKELPKEAFTGRKE